MLALSNNVIQFLSLLGAGVFGAIILGAGKAVMGIVRTRQTRQRENIADQKTLSEFFFGVKSDPRTGTPGREGWCVTVDRTLAQLTDGLDQVVKQLTPDHNGRHNLHGVVERTAEALGVELPPPEDPE